MVKPLKVTIGISLLILSFAAMIVMMSLVLKASGIADRVLEGFGLPRGYATGLASGMVALVVTIIAAIVAIIIAVAAYNVIRSEG